MNNQKFYSILKQWSSLFACEVHIKKSRYKEDSEINNCAESSKSRCKVSIN